MIREKNGKKIEKSGTVLWIVLMIITPIIISGLFALFRMVIAKEDPFPGIKWNDEAVYLKLIENYSRYLSPKGYWGFDGNHAILGSGPAWSPAIILPYALLAKIFPTGQYFIFFANLFFITAANLIFWAFVRPDREECIRLTGFQAFFVPLLLYLTTNMSELFRYALAIILAGMMYYLYYRKGKWFLKYLLIPLFLLYTIQVYTFFAFAVPLYVGGLLKEKKWYVRFLVALPVTGIVAGGSYYLLHLISSNYNIGKTEGLLAALSAKDFGGALRSLLSMLKEGLFGIWNLKDYFRTEPMYPFSVILALVLTGVGVFMALRGKSNPEKKADEGLGIMIGHSVSLFYLMYLTLYTIVPDTFYRGTQIVILFSLYLLAMSKREYLVRLLLLVSLAGVFLMGSRYRYFTEGRYIASSYTEEWKQMRDKMDIVLQADPEAGLWDNTVLMYTMEPKAICSIPAGLAENFVLTEGVFNSKAGYLFFCKTDPRKTDPEWIVRSYERILAENEDTIRREYTVIYEDEEYIVYKRGGNE